MSVPACVLRNLSGVETLRINNLTTTPTFTWNVTNGRYLYFFGSVTLSVTDSYTTPTRSFTLPKAVDSIGAGWVPYGSFFAETSYLITTVGSANGAAYIGASPSTLTTGLYGSGTALTLRAVATNPLYKFSKWTLGGADFSTSPTVSITTTTADATYTAVFVPISHTLNVTAEDANEGTVAVAIDDVPQLTTTGLSVSSGVSYSDPVIPPADVEIAATPAFGYSFDGWYVSGSLLSASATYSFPMPASALSIEARFTALAAAPLTVTKTKGNAGDAAAAKDQGSVSLYHLESVLDTTSAVGTATLAANLYNTKQYKLTASPASSLYQFDGWYQTVDGSEVAITTGGIFTVTGSDLYITPTTTTAIPVNAQFRARTPCTIAAVASDSSVYVAGNDAEDAGCTCAVTAPDPDLTSPDRWLSGQTVTVAAVQAAGWELRQWIVKLAASPYTILSSLSKGDTGFGQTYSFNITANAQVIARSAYTLPPDQMQIQALHKTGQDTASGALEIHPCGDNYVALMDGVMANVDENSVCELTAIPANGYKFVNWRIAAIDGTIVSTVPVYSFTVTASAVYYAEFAATTEESLLLFEGGEATMLGSWRGRINIANIPINFSCARVYADGYPVAIDVGAAESPSSPLLASKIVRTITNDQDAIRLVSGRREKYSMIGFEANTVVNAITVATSMGDLRNG